MARRDSRAGLRHIYHSDTTDTDGATPFEPMDDSFGTTTNGDVPPYAREMRDMREEISVLRNMISASFDLQLDIQRSIRQEVSAAMNNIATPSTMETSACTSDATHRKPASKEMTSQPVAAGLCTVCLEKNVDSLLYGCGHMCTCSLCGRQLVAGGQSCPICRAPVRDVVRAFVVTE